MTFPLKKIHWKLNNPKKRKKKKRRNIRSIIKINCGLIFVAIFAHLNNYFLFCAFLANFKCAEAFVTVGCMGKWTLFQWHVWNRREKKNLHTFPLIEFLVLILCFLFRSHYFSTCFVVSARFIQLFYEKFIACQRHRNHMRHNQRISKIISML